MVHPLTNRFPWQLISLFTEKLQTHLCSGLNRFTPPATSSIISLLFRHKCETLTHVFASCLQQSCSIIDINREYEGSKRGLPLH